MSNDLTTIGARELSTQDQAILRMRMDSKTYRRLYKYEKSDAVFEMSKIVSKAFLYRGQAADPNNINFISSALVDELLQEQKYNAKFLSFEEIGLIVKNAVLGNAEMFGISVASLYKVIMDWIKTDGTRLQNEAAELRKQQRMDSLKESVVGSLISDFSNKFSLTHKI